MEQSPSIGSHPRLLLQGGSVPFRLSPFEIVSLLALLTVAAFAGFSGYAKVTDMNAPVATPPTYIPAFRTTLSSSVTTTGTIASSQQVTLTFGSTGKIKEFLVGLGAQVTTGQALARIDDTDLQQTAKSAQSNLDSAQARLNAALQPPQTTDVASSLQAVNNAQGQLATARQNYADLKAKPTPSDTITAQQGLLTAQSALQTAQDNQTKTQNDATQASIDLAAAQAAFTDATNRVKQSYSAAHDAYDACSTAVLKPAFPDLLLPYQSAPALSPSMCTAPAFSAYGTASTAYNSAVTAYTSAQTALTAKQTANTNAQNALSNGNLARAVQNAQLGLQNAQQKVTDTQAGAKPSDLDAAQRAIDSAQAALDSAQAKNDALFAAPKPENILPLQASVDQAKAQLETARANLAAATIVAPFDGQISSLTGEVGSQVAANTPVFILLNPKLIRIDANVDQSSIGNLKVGQTATVTLDAISGRTYTATITAIGLTPVTQQGVVTYVVTFGVDTSRLAQGTPIPAPGMTASLSIQTSRTEDALVVPARAIRRVSRTQQTVKVKTDAGQEDRTVTVGATNGTLTEIVSGLKDGELVLVSAPAATSTTTTPTQPGGGQPQFPGFPGGGP